MWLAQCEYKVTGADFSPALLDKAKNKAQEKDMAIRFIEGDMRTIKVGIFDAAITIDNAVGHLTKADFEVAMKNIHSNLKDGGLYVFDIYNVNAMTDHVVTNLAMDRKKTANKKTFHQVQYSEIDRESGQLTSHDCFTIQEGLDNPKIFRGTFTLQIYTAQELKEMLTRNGFETLSQCSLDESKFSESETTNILTVAKKL